MVQSRVPYYMAWGFQFVSLIFCIVAFGTGNWYEAEPSFENPKFIRLGLWEACFNGYEHTSDYIGKAYYGCWWIFHPEYRYIRSWIMPKLIEDTSSLGWFIAVQTFMTLAFCFEFIIMMLLPYAASISTKSLRYPILLFSCCMFLPINSIKTSVTCLAISVTTFGVMIGVDRTWMPRFDANRLSWSFGLAVVSGFMSAFGTICAGVHLSQRFYHIHVSSTTLISNVLHLIPYKELDYMTKVAYVTLDENEDTEKMAPMIRKRVL